MTIPQDSFGDRSIIEALPKKPPAREEESEAGKDKKEKSRKFASHNNRSLTHQAATAAWMMDGNFVGQTEFPSRFISLTG